MDRAIRKVSVEEGADPREAVLVAFGGAGGLHATALARRLEMAAVIVPPMPGCSRRSACCWPRRGPMPPAACCSTGEAGLSEPQSPRWPPRRWVALGGGGAVSVRGRRAIPGPVARDLGALSRRVRRGRRWSARFHEAHRQRNGFDRPDDPIEVVTVRAEAVGHPGARAGTSCPTPAPTGESRGRGIRKVLTAEGQADRLGVVAPRPARRATRSSARPSSRSPRPPPTSAPGERAVVHESGALEVTW